MAKPKLILDCDPGHDDAVAILFAAKHTELLGITTVSGNVPLDLTTRNALITAQILNINVPVYIGAERPLVAEAVHAPDIHGETGLGGPELPELARRAEEQDAVSYLIETIRQVNDVWLVITGPCTNAALAFRQAPDIVKRLKGISVMGGSSTFGNRTPAAEFNILADPEAADIVFNCGAPILMSGLNLTHQFAVTEKDVAKIREIGGGAAVFVADMLGFFAKTYKERYFGTFEGPLHDPCAVMAITHPELFTFEARNVAVELRGEHTRGMTVVDTRGVKSDLPLNVQVGLSVKRAEGMKLLLDTIRMYS